MNTNTQTTIISTQRGKNIGANIKDSLIKANLYDKVRLKTINTVRDIATRTNVTTVQYEFKI